MMVGFKNSPGTEPISLAELEREYCRVTQQPFPIAEMEFARSWMLFRVRHHLSFTFTFLHSKIQPLPVSSAILPC
jgi:hypothetical protein